ncbi:MAG: glycosyltransferase family 4 protein, partial [Planctomycetes bacterium]|nr:glycosyltransferase family 4 protein [Planctomycetota bacterium]
MRFKASSEDLYDKYGDAPDPLPIGMLTAGEDFEYAPGGVTRMLPPLLKSMYRDGLIKKPHWISLNSLGPEDSATGSLAFHSVRLAPHEAQRYGRFKEAIWKNLHGVERTPVPRDYFPGYALFNWKVAERALELHSREDFDLFYVHDFQLLLTGSMLGPTAAKVFRWHIPINVEGMLPEWRSFLLRRLEDYDAVIVSCKSYRHSLMKGGFRGKAYQIYPHIDPGAYGEPRRSRVSQLCADLGIADDDQVLLLVARLDPMKGQDIAIKALAHVARRHPKLKLLMVGNGSFTSTRRGGLGLPKGLRWKAELEGLARSLGVEDRIIFAGFLPWDVLNAAYARSDAVVLS